MNHNPSWANTFVRLNLPIPILDLCCLWRCRKYTQNHTGSLSNFSLWRDRLVDNSRVDVVVLSDVNERTKEWTVRRRGKKRIITVVVDTVIHTETKRTMVMIDSPICGFRWRHCKHDVQWLLRQSPKTASISSFVGVGDVLLAVLVLVVLIVMVRLVSKRKNCKVRKTSCEWAKERRMNVSRCEQCWYGDTFENSARGFWIPCSVNWPIPRSPLLER